MEYCNTCKFWEKIYGPMENCQYIGFCRRFPPTRNSENTSAYAAKFSCPVTKADTWCGEWKEKPNVNA